MVNLLTLWQKPLAITTKKTTHPWELVSKNVSWIRSSRSRKKEQKTIFLISDPTFRFGITSQRLNPRLIKSSQHAQACKMLKKKNQIKIKIFGNKKVNKKLTDQMDWIYFNIKYLKNS